MSMKKYRADIEPPMRTALCSYDAGILLAMGNYLTETDGFGRCVAFRSGAALLRELCAGQHFDTLVLDEQRSIWMR